MQTRLRPPVDVGVHARRRLLGQLLEVLPIAGPEAIVAHVEHERDTDSERRRGQEQKYRERAAIEVRNGRRHDTLQEET